MTNILKLSLLTITTQNPQRGAEIKRIKEKEP